uniref:HNH domain-containing protein n=1 Tax=Pyrodinium bahamense TaxID=73915 RepID=A0A7S0B7J4_9DINO
MAPLPPLRRAAVATAVAAAATAAKGLAGSSCSTAARPACPLPNARWAAAAGPSSGVTQQAATVHGAADSKRWATCLWSVNDRLGVAQPAAVQPVLSVPMACLRTTIAPGWGALLDLERWTPWRPPLIVRAVQHRAATSLFRHARKTGDYLAINGHLGGTCGLCGTDQELTVHHLVPKLQWKRMRRKGRVKGKDDPPKAVLCRTCHSMVHRTYSHAELARSYGSLEKLLHADGLVSFIERRRGWSGSLSRSRSRSS